MYSASVATRWQQSFAVTIPEIQLNLQCGETLEFKPKKNMAASFIFAVQMIRSRFFSPKNQEEFLI